MSHAIKTSHYVPISLKLKSCARHNSHIVRDNLIIFGGDIYQVKLKCQMQEVQLLFGFFL